MTQDGTIIARYGDIRRDHAVSEEVYQNPENVAHTVVTSQFAKIYMKDEQETAKDVTEGGKGE